MDKKITAPKTTEPMNFDALRQRIRERFPDLSPHLQRIARASLEEPNKFALNTTPVIALSLGVQPSTLIRFAKEFGFTGFTSLQKVFRQRLIEGDPNVRDQVLEQDKSTPTPDLQTVLLNCANEHIRALEHMTANCDLDALNTAIQYLRNANHIYIAGLRRSRPIAEYFHYGLLRGERACTMLDFSGGMAGPQIATIGLDDVLFAIGFTPYSKPVLDVVLDAHVSGRRVVALTDSPESPLAKYAEVFLQVGTDATNQFQPISAAIALVQSLAMGVTKP